MPISEKQRRILEFIAHFFDQNEYPPTLEDIRQGMRISTKSLVSYHLHVQETAGYLEKTPGKPRSIQLRLRQ